MVRHILNISGKLIGREMKRREECGVLLQVEAETCRKKGLQISRHRERNETLDGFASFTKTVASGNSGLRGLCRKPRIVSSGNDTQRQEEASG